MTRNEKKLKNKSLKGTIYQTKGKASKGKVNPKKFFYFKNKIKKNKKVLACWRDLSVILRSLVAVFASTTLT